MKKYFTLIHLLVLSLISVFAQAQDAAPFAINGKIREVLSTASKGAKARLSCGDELYIDITNGMQMLVEVGTKHGKIGKNITIISSDKSPDLPYVEVFEYDFDEDGTKEVCVAYSFGAMSFQVEVYRYTGGLSELVGNFEGQMSCELKKNRIEFLLAHKE